MGPLLSSPSVLGKTNRPRKIKYTRAATVKAIPIGVTAKRPKGSTSGLVIFIMSFSRIKGLEPIRVIHPPIIAQYPMGIRIRETGIPVCLPIRRAAGMNKAAAPIFCIKLEIKATVDEISVTIRLSLFPANLRIMRASEFMAPVLSRPAPIMMTAIMETTALLDKPLMASLGVTRPSNGSPTIMIIPTTSTRTHSKINSRMATQSTPRTSMISGVIFASSLQS